jgi:hypothetical protein
MYLDVACYLQWVLSFISDELLIQVNSSLAQPNCVLTMAWTNTIRADVGTEERVS